MGKIIQIIFLTITYPLILTVFLCMILPLLGFVNLVVNVATNDYDWELLIDMVKAIHPVNYFDAFMGGK